MQRRDYDRIKYKEIGYMVNRDVDKLCEIFCVASGRGGMNINEINKSVID